ncbi:MAG TPA: redoxin domain-containing protein [Anaerolineae bacterium]|nr:redoxin domain-containing protein [Anaerolineae bacterium]
MFRRTRARGRTVVAKPSRALAPGTPAPDFSLPSTADREISLSDFRGQPVILVFYPADFSSLCGDQLVLYNEVLPVFKEYNAQVLAISVDGIWSHKAFSEQRNLGFPLLSDFEPKGAVAQAYGVYNSERGVNQRALFVVDSQGMIRWSHVSPANVNPGADGILRALESLGA